MKKLRTSELNRLTIEEFRNKEKLPVVIILDNIRSQNNTGSVFRTADAFRIRAIHLCGITSTPPHREIHKSALGATESVEWKYFSTTLDSVKELKNAGYFILAVEQTDKSISIDQFSPHKDKPVAIIFGNEVNGIDENLLNEVDACVDIPQYGTKHSLNVSVASGIIVWELFRKMGFSLNM